MKTGANGFFYVKGDHNQRSPQEAASRARGSLSPDISLPGAGKNSEPEPDENSLAAIKRLGEVAHVRRGLTTGANDFFYLTPLAENVTIEATENEKMASRYRLDQQDKFLIPVEDGT